ncbi:MAG: hypothetical protein GYA51_12585 [Candidatus Methanofastidiosa archaeon]|nr:hypothetical protein [Candidatus Methanofastidiosa archaeon]
MEENLFEGFMVIDFPLEHRWIICTTNSLERVSKKTRRLTRVVRVFPNEDSCLRLVSAILMEFNEDWEYGRIYLSMESS